VAGRFDNQAARSAAAHGRLSKLPLHSYCLARGKMKVHWRQHLPVLALVTSLMAVMIGLVAYAPTLYRMFCAFTGYGGTVRRAVALDPAAAEKGAVGPAFTVHFDSNVAPGLAWRFDPVQRDVVVHAGEPTKVYYEATNLSDETIVAHATYNVTPYEAAPYFFKIQCFCFTDERLGPHETARMPLVFYVDEQMLKDVDAQEIRDITLSYTFFKQSDVAPGDIATARDLTEGSKALDVKLGGGDKIGFDNDAPRQ
jgi:cytochrome c oxidase assembly protein subunit 11